MLPTMCRPSPPYSPRSVITTKHLRMSQDAHRMLTGGDSPEHVPFGGSLHVCPETCPGPISIMRHGRRSYSPHIEPGGLKERLRCAWAFALRRSGQDSRPQNTTLTRRESDAVNRVLT